MPASYRSINYSLRPAKAIERKMLCTAFRRLQPIQRVEEYRYVGFGAIHFSDFYLFHRELGISDMLSIERETDSKACFRFNKPFKCIELKFGPSSEVLPGLDWEKNSIVWLDYDDPLDRSIISDIATLTQRLSAGSVLIVSVNAHPRPDPGVEARQRYEEETGSSFNLDDYRMRIVQELVGEKLPSDVTGVHLRGQELGRVFHRIIAGEIAEQLSIRNGLISAEDRLLFRQLFNFRYSDSAKMITVGGVFYDSSQIDRMDKCDFEFLPFVRTGSDAYAIEVPQLTPKEIRHLNSQLPSVPATKLCAPGVPSGDLTRFLEVYRYFPTFSEIFNG